jgi:hypothetical protein
MHESPERGPQDYPPWDDERRILINIIRRQNERAGGGNYNEAPKSHLTAIVIGCTITLLSAFVIGAWKLSNDQAAFIAQVTEWQRSIERRIDALERRP